MDFNNILPTDFVDTDTDTNTHTHIDNQHQQSSATGTLNDPHLLDPQLQTDDYYNHDESQSQAQNHTPVQNSGKRRNGGDGEHDEGDGRDGVEFKKEKQRNLNRRAAEKSRNKKREELTTLELTVNNVQEENQRLRQHLANLLAQQRPQPANDEVIIPSAVTASNGSSGIDYLSLRKLQQELSEARKTLLEREIAVRTARLNQASGSRSQQLPASDMTTAEVSQLRNSILVEHDSLSVLQKEMKSLHGIIEGYRSERDDLAKQRVITQKELEARRSLRDVVDQPGVPGGANGAVGVERALLDMRGWVDSAVKTWEQTSILPAPRELDDESIARLANLASTV